MKIQGADRLGKRQAPGGRVVLVRGGALGDFVLTLPLVQALGRLCPGARLVLVGNPRHADLAGAPHQADVIDADSAAWSRMYTPTGADQDLRQRLRDCRLLVACVPGGRHGAGAHYLRNLQDLCTDIRVGDPLPEPAQRRHMSSRLLDVMGVPVSTGDDVVDLQPVIRLATTPPRGDLIILHPGSGSRSKCWPAPYFARLLGWLQSCHLPVAVLWGPAEMARAMEFPAALTDAAVALSPDSPLALADCLARARLYVGNDTGPGHVAAAVGCPTLSLFGPTDPGLWRPLGPKAQVLRAPAGDLSRVTVEMVIEAVKAALDDHRPGPEAG